MASSVGKSDKSYKRAESRNKHSWWWDSHISPKNSKWLAENLEEMEQSVKRMLKLLAEEGDSFAKKAEMYYQKRPQLVTHVEEFYRMYRSLAERYDNVTGELRKNIPSDLHSQGSGITDEPPSTMPSPDHNRRRSGTRAAGFDVFLKNGGSSSDLGTREGDETSTLDSELESESDDSSVNNYSSASANSNSRRLRKKIADLEAEVRKLQSQQEQGTVAEYEEQLRAANEKIRFSEDLVSKLTVQLQKHQSLESQHDTLVEDDESLRFKGADFSEQECKIGALEEDLKATREKLVGAEEEAKRLKHELENDSSSKNALLEKLGLAQKDILSWKSKFEKEKREVMKLHDRISRYKANLSERDQEIRSLRETVSNANQSLSEENKQLQEQVTKVSKERGFLDDSIKEWDLRCQCLEEDVRRMKIQKAEMEGEIEQLKAENVLKDECVQELETERDEVVAKVLKLENEVSVKDEQMEELNKTVNQLRLKHTEMVSQMEESEREMVRLQQMIEGGAEEKREAIRQLCFSLEHYRSEYQMLWQAFVARNKGHLVS